MPATLLNAPARPLLTGRTIILLSMVPFAVIALALLTDPHPDHAVTNRPAFTRRMTTLPAIVVTAREPAHPIEGEEFVED
jgi:hypothetical protein